MCRNPFCEDEPIARGFCNRCYRLVTRNGTYSKDDDIPAFSDNKLINNKILIERVVTSARVHKMPLAEFLFVNKLSEDRLTELENELDINYEELLL